MATLPRRTSGTTLNGHGPHPVPTSHSEPAPHPSKPRRPGPPREFLLACRDHEGDRVGGFGVTLADAVRECVAGFTQGDADEVPRFYPSIADRRATQGDEVVWDGNRVAAVVLARPGSDVPLIYRFDSEGAPVPMTLGVAEPTLEDEPADGELADVAGLPSAG